MFFVFYFACFVSAQNTGLIPPFLNATSSIRNATSSAGRTSSTLFTTGSASTTAFSTTRAFSTLSTSLTTNTTIPSPPTSTPLSCPTSNNTLYTAPSGQTFVIECSIDHSRGDLSSLSTPDLEACIAACDATDECLDVTLSGSEFLPPLSWTMVANVMSQPPATSNPSLAPPSLLRVFWAQDFSEPARR